MFHTPQFITQQAATKAFVLAQVGNITGTLTPSRLVASDGLGALTSVGNLASWIAGTSNQISVANDGDGTVTLSTPQNIHTGASPTFADLTLTGNLVVDNNVTLGSSDADEITINAGTALVTSFYGLQINKINTTTDFDITAVAGAFHRNQAVSASSMVVTALIFRATQESSSSLAQLRGIFGSVHNTSGGTGTVSFSAAVNPQILFEGAATLTDVIGVYPAANFNAACTVSNLYGTLNAVTANSGGATVTTNTLFDTNTQTVGTNIRGYRGRIAAASGRHNLYLDGTADNSIAGLIKCNSTFGFTSTFDGTADVILVRDAAAVLALKDSTTNQSLRVYGSTTGPDYTTVTNNGSAGIISTSGGSLQLNPFSKNILLNSGAGVGLGLGVVSIPNATTNPSTNPTAGGILYSDAGAGKWRGSGGTVTTFGPA